MIPYIYNKVYSIETGGVSLRIYSSMGEMRQV